jgi:hypothetical protein
MTVERRDKKSDRRRTRWGVRTGMVALLTVGGGCGPACTSYVRPDLPKQSGAPAGAKVSPVTLDDPARPGDPTARLAALGRMAKGGGPVEIDAVEPLARQVRDDKNGPLFYTPTVWNGWKVPPAKSDTAVASTAPAPSPAPAPVAALASAPASVPLPALAATSPGSGALPAVPSLSQPAVTDPAESGNPLQAACREIRIAPPRSAAAGATDPGSTQLLSASRDTRIAPPFRKEASVPAEGGSEPVDGLLAACRDTKIAPPLRRPTQAVSVASPTAVPVAAAPAPSPPVAAPASAAEATKPDLATVAEALKVEPAAPKVEPAPLAEAPKVEPAPVAEAPKSAPVPAAEVPKAEPAPAATVASPKAEPVPAPAPTPTPTPAVVDTKPAAVEPVVPSPGPAVASVPPAAPAESPALTQRAELPALSAVANGTLQASSSASSFELHRRPAEVAPVLDSVTKAVDNLPAAAATGIELARRPAASTGLENATKAAVAIASQGLASPASQPANQSAPTAPDSLAAASRASNIPLPTPPTPGTLEDACRKTNLPLPIPASDQ